MILRRSMQRIINLAVAAFILAAVFQPLRPASAHKQAQATSPAEKARATLAKLTAEEKVGQLFLVGFSGSQVDTNSQIYDLIYNRHIGGVILLAENDNFTGEDTLVNLQSMIAGLQQIEWDSSLKVPDDSSAESQFEPNYIPLLVGTSQEGDGYPDDQLFSGLTPLPSEMAIGATWNTNLARQVGSDLGSKLSVLGINLLLGPSLDVLERQDMAAGEQMGTTVFGGDPYWVSEMGKAYIQGVHEGSFNHIAVIAKHFPGQGSADRVPEDEVATVRKTLEQLKQMELAPFFAVTGDAENQAETADGVLVSHIRYQGFQDNIRVTTKPVSLDPALTAILSLPEFKDWHSLGGLVVSNDLGAQAVRQVYDPTGQTFDARRVAREAFLAGNDLLYLNRFIGTGDPDTYATILKTLESFVTKYREDPAFAQRVDESVTRILTRKYTIYPQFDLANVTTSPDGAAAISRSVGSSQISFEVARSAVTLLSPEYSALPRPPETRERILFITDSLSGSQCSSCSKVDFMPVDGLQSAALRLYGPNGTGQVSQSRMSSYSFHDLLVLLNSTNTGAEPLPLQSDLDYADWIIFSSLNFSTDRPDSEALRRFLSERAYLVSTKKVVVFAFNKPYDLDATDISKLTAYFAMYSKTPAFLEVAARVLFQEIKPTGASPVSISGTGYDLLSATSPDPNQIIPLGLDISSIIPTAEPGVTPSPQAVTFKVGDTLPLQAGVILDHNGNPIPDNTVVKFIVTVDGGAGGIEQIEALSGAEGNVDGTASAVYRISREGLLEIRVESESAITSKILRLPISGTESAGVTPIVPTIETSETLTPTPTSTPTATPTLVPEPPPPSSPGFTDWVLAMLIIAISGGLTYFGGLWWGSLRWGLRWSICAVLGGLAAYTYVAVGLPGGKDLVQNSGTSGLISVTFLGVLIGLGIGLAWRSWLEERTRSRRST